MNTHRYDRYMNHQCIAFHLFVYIPVEGTLILAVKVEQFVWISWRTNGAQLSHWKQHFFLYKHYFRLLNPMILKMLWSHNRYILLGKQLCLSIAVRFYSVKVLLKESQTYIGLLQSFLDDGPGLFIHLRFIKRFSLLTIASI